MDGYAPAYVAHNTPFLVISGVGASQGASGNQDGGIRIASETSFESDDAENLLRYFRESDAENLAWNGREYSGRNKFRIKIVGRVAESSYF
jgi:hypothetical protein